MVTLPQVADITCLQTILLEVQVLYNSTETNGVISGTTGTGFTNITSTAFTGTLATAAQPNVTSLGTLSALAISGPISGTGLITNSNLTGAQNDNVVSTLLLKHM